MGSPIIERAKSSEGTASVGLTASGIASQWPRGGPEVKGFRVTGISRRGLPEKSSGVVKTVRARRSGNSGNRNRKPLWDKKIANRKGRNEKRSYLSALKIGLKRANVVGGCQFPICPD